MVSLQQLVKRLLEEVQNQSFVTRNIDVCNEIEFLDRYNSYPILENIHGIQFRSVKIPKVGYLKSNEEADNCRFLKDMSVVVIYDIVKCPYNNVVIGKKFENQHDALKTNSYLCCSFVIQEFVLFPHLKLTLNVGTLETFCVRQLGCLVQPHWNHL
jgi:hypothetical protein